MSKPSYFTITLIFLLGAFWFFSLQGFSQLTAEFSPDTWSYYQFSVYRQPLYGNWMLFMHEIFSNWPAVKFTQLIIYCLCVTAVVRELYLVSIQGKYSAFALILFFLALGKYGITAFVSSLISEGLFYSGLIGLMALTIRWLRCPKLTSLVLLVFLCVLLSQLKTAFLPVLGLLVLLFLLVLIYFFRVNENRNKKNCLVICLSFIVLIMFVPSMLGKDILQVSTIESRLGFVVIPRIAMLPTPPHLLEKLRSWENMARSWREVSNDLGVLAFTQFDAQMQEAVRYKLYTSEISSLLNNMSKEHAHDNWIQNKGYTQASNLAFEWIHHSPILYLSNSFKHLAGLLMAAPLMLQGERDQVRQAFTEVASETWEKVELRKDYPLGNLDFPISKITQAFYFFIKVFVLIYLLVSFISIIKLVKAFWMRTTINNDELFIVWSFALVITLSIAPALTVFPEIRYVYANLIIMFCGLLGYIAFYDDSEPLIQFS